MAHRAYLFSFSLLAIFAVPGSLSAQDCNQNGVEDLLDVAPPPEYLPQVVPLPDEAHRVEVADFDRDGDLDYAEINGIQNVNNVAVHINLGAAGFAPEVIYNPGVGYPDNFSSADVDGDGDVDLIVEAATATRGPVVALVNNGAGVFDQIVNLGQYGDATPAVSADFNADGIVDFAMGEASQALSVNYVAADGTFSRLQFVTPGPLMRLAAGDLDGDGRAEIVGANWPPATAVNLFMNRNGGTFPNSTPVEAGQDPSDLVLVDVDEDGDLDLVVANVHSSDLSVLFNDGKGGLGGTRRFPTGAQPTYLGVADLNGDGHRDLLTTSYGDFLYVVNGDILNTYSTLLGDGKGNFSFHADHITAPGPFDPRLNDWTGDGIPDLLVSSRFGYLMFNRSLGDGTMATSLQFEIPEGASAATLGDFNGDARADFAVMGTGRGVVAVRLNQGNGTFGPAMETLADASDATAIAAGDLDGDGKADLALTSPTQNVRVFHGRGDAGFDPPASLFPGGDEPRALTLGDFDGDGDLDLVTANILSGNVSLFTNAGKGTFSAPKQYAVGNSPVALAVADVNGDGRKDLAVANFGADDISILRGDPASGLLDANSVKVGRGPRAIALGDLDRDGDADLVVARFGPKDVVIFANAGDGTFQENAAFPLINPDTVSIGDLDGDGDLDVAVVNLGSDLVSYLLNDGTGNFVPGPEFETPIIGLIATPSLVIAADLNGDLRSELLYVLPGVNHVRILRNFAEAWSFDCDHDLQPDECQSLLDPIAADIDRDGVSDLCDNCPEDANADQKDTDADGKGDTCDAIGPPVPAYKRGDADGLGTIDITDSIFLLNYLFLAGAVSKCPDAADADDSGVLDLTDPIFLLNYQFGGGAPPPPPGALTCGLDGSADELPVCTYPDTLCR